LKCSGGAFYLKIEQKPHPSYPISTVERGSSKSRGEVKFISSENLMHGAMYNIAPTKSSKSRGEVKFISALTGGLNA